MDLTTKQTEGYAKIRKTLFSVDQLTIEATGSVIQFDQMVHNLKKDFIVKLIKVDTDPELCLQRVKARDQQNHIPVSDKQVIDINKISAQRTFDFDLIVPNNSQTDNELLEELSQLK
jgi:dephospho-CoA kinase